MASVNIVDFEILCSLGNLKDSIQAIKALKTGISEVTLKQDNVPYYLLKKRINQNQDEIYSALKNLLQKLIKNMDRKSLGSTALIMGTSLVDWHLVDAINSCAYEYKKSPYNSKKRSIDSYAKDLALEFVLGEFTMSINTACTSSANALLEAKNLIDAEVVEQVIVMGLEIFSPVMSSGFHSMELISKSRPKPFDVKRDGLVLGEALCGMVLGKQSSDWELLGGFSNCNSQTITSVSQSGQECVEVMQNALKNSALHVEDITALKAHATGSLSNDEAEMNAIKKLFSPSLVFTALKPYVGHTIGASGVLEIALLMSAVDDGFLPRTIFCDEPMDDDFRAIENHKECRDGTFMCNYFGFGGNNTSLIIKKAKT